MTSIAWRALLERLLAGDRSAAADLSEQLGELQSQFASLKNEVGELRSLLSFTREEVLRAEAAGDVTRSMADTDEQLFHELLDYRKTDSYREIYEGGEPLVSVCINTYNREKLLVERCLASVLAQTYSKLDVVVVGDGCSDGTAEAVAKIGDPRVTFVNLEREVYPADATAVWLTAGIRAGNHAMALAKGDLITHLDDDDEYTPDRIQTLVDVLREQRAELIWHPFWWEIDEGKWIVNAAERFRLGQVTTGSVLYLAWLKRLPWDSRTFLYREPGDWNRFRKLKYLGVKLVRHSEPLLRHYRERTHRGE